MLAEKMNSAQIESEAISPDCVGSKVLGYATLEQTLGTPVCLIKPVTLMGHGPAVGPRRRQAKPSPP